MSLKSMLVILTVVLCLAAANPLLKHENERVKRSASSEEKYKEDFQQQHPKHHENRETRKRKISKLELVLTMMTIGAANLNVQARSLAQKPPTVLTQKLNSKHGCRLAELHNNLVSKPI
ncbi:uncharacterized protein [Euwallacea fornicatus]|uniref:uncharacterized protein n=1 Tax=Euwallacea fornicatus TaxID=995702 RepID=UPI00338ED7F7